MKKILFMGILLLAGLFSLQYSLLGNRSTLAISPTTQANTIYNQSTECVTQPCSDTIIIIQL
jgi:hypothetical protein